MLTFLAFKQQKSVAQNSVTKTKREQPQYEHFLYDKSLTTNITIGSDKPRLKKKKQNKTKTKNKYKKTALAKRFSSHVSEVLC